MRLLLRGRQIASTWWVCGIPHGKPIICVLDTCVWWLQPPANCLLQVFAAHPIPSHPIRPLIVSKQSWGWDIVIAHTSSQVHLQLFFTVSAVSKATSCCYTLR